MNHTMRNPAKGISILEILILVSLIVVVLAFASPSLNRVNARAELSTAVEQMESSILVARQTARTLHTDVLLLMHTGKREKQNSISLAFPAFESPPQAVALPQETLLPESVRLVTSQRAVLFDSQGMVEEPVYFTLQSTLDNGVAKKMLIE